MSDEVPQWSDDEVAEAFRSEIRARLEAHNVRYREREAIELEAVLAAHPENRGQPGFEVRDSGTWEIYQASEIRIERNSVTIVLPRWSGTGIEFVYLFDHTTVAWSRPRIGAIVVDGQARATIEITLVETWTDEMDARWRTDGNDQKRVLVELYESDVEKLVIAIAQHEDASAIRARLELALEALP